MTVGDSPEEQPAREDVEAEYSVRPAAEDALVKQSHDQHLLEHCPGLQQVVKQAIVTVTAQC